MVRRLLTRLVVRYLGRIDDAGSTPLVERVSDMVLVLLVDNDNTHLTANADALLAAGHQVCTAINGQEAIEELDWNQPDVVICASSMPLVDGWELVRHIRGDERHRGVPILFMGQSDDKELRLAAFRSGVDDYLPKPFEAEELVRRVDRVLGRSRIVERPDCSVPPCDIQGRLENFPLASVMRLLGSESKTGVLLIGHSRERVRLVFRNGEPIRAHRDDDLTAYWQACLPEALAWSSGDFWFFEQPVQGEDEIQTSVHELLDGTITNCRFGRRA